MKPKITTIELFTLNQMRACENAGSHMRWIWAGPAEVQAARRLVRKGFAREFRDGGNFPAWLPVKQENEV